MLNGSAKRTPHGIYPGSFDPLTLGHLDVIERAAAVFTRLTVAVVANPQKREPLFDLDERKALLERCVAHLPHVDVRDFRGLLADFVRELQVDVIIKGLRVVSDFEVEMSTALMNRSLSNVDTMFLMSDQHYSFISSSLVKEVFFLGGDVAKYVPDVVMRAMVAKREARKDVPRVRR
jgi:pantetheine-phosphate adenylyltransferase